MSPNLHLTNCKTINLINILYRLKSQYTSLVCINARSINWAYPGSFPARIPPCWRSWGADEPDVNCHWTANVCVRTTGNVPGESVRRQAGGHMEHVSQALVTSWRGDHTSVGEHCEWTREEQLKDPWDGFHKYSKLPMKCFTALSYNIPTIRRKEDF